MEIRFVGSGLRRDEAEALITHATGAPPKQCELQSVGSVRGDPAIIAALIGAGGALLGILIQQTCAFMMERQRKAQQDQFRPVSITVYNIIVAHAGNEVLRRRIRYTQPADIEPVTAEIRGLLPESADANEATRVEIERID